MKQDILNQIIERSVKTGYNSGVRVYDLGYKPSDPAFKACIKELIAEKLIKYYDNPNGWFLMALKR